MDVLPPMLLLVLALASTGAAECPKDMLTGVYGGCYYETNCKPDIYGNIYCENSVPYDTLELLLHNRNLVLVVIVLPCMIITGAVIAAVIMRQRRSA